MARCLGGLKVAVSAAEDRSLVLGAMRSGEWLRTQWIARVAFDLGNRRWTPEHARRIRIALEELQLARHVESRVVSVRREGTIEGVPVAFQGPRDEWRITDSGRRAERTGVWQVSDESLDWFALTWLEVHLLPQVNPHNKVRRANSIGVLPPTWSPCRADLLRTMVYGVTGRPRTP
jgi:hypothetical protein